MSTLVFTRHTVAFPMNSLPDGDTEEISVSLDADGGGTEGEFIWRFVTFRDGTNAVQVRVFGDGLPCFLDERVQAVFEQWSSLSNPDEMTPEMLCSSLLSEGAVPSRYMLNPTPAPQSKRERAAALMTDGEIDRILDAHDAL